MEKDCGQAGSEVMSRRGRGDVPVIRRSWRNVRCRHGV